MTDYGAKLTIILRDSDEHPIHRFLLNNKQKFHDNQVHEHTIIKMIDLFFLEPLILPSSALAKVKKK